MSKTDTIHLGGWEVDINNAEELINFIIQHRLEEHDFETFTAIQSGLEMKVVNGKITEVLLQKGDERLSGPIDIVLPKCNIHKLFWLKASSNGTHHIGGKPPAKVRFYTDDNFKPLYIGCLNCLERWFSWTNMSNFHIYYPLDYYEPVYIDYSNENQPRLISSNPTHEFSINSYLSTQKLTATAQIDIEEIGNNSANNHQCGVPLWYQYPVMPKCPETGELMSFVCSINSTRKVHLMKRGLFGNKKTGRHLIFGDMGTLYIFYHPKSKIAFQTVQF